MAFVCFLFSGGLGGGGLTTRTVGRLKVVFAQFQLDHHHHLTNPQFPIIIVHVHGAHKRTGTLFPDESEGVSNEQRLFIAVLRSFITMSGRYRHKKTRGDIIFPVFPLDGSRLTTENRLSGIIRRWTIDRFDNTAGHYYM
jgi:hypothetical protein